MDTMASNHSATAVPWPHQHLRGPCMAIAPLPSCLAQHLRHRNRASRDYKLTARMSFTQGIHLYKSPSSASSHRTASSGITRVSATSPAQAQSTRRSPPRNLQTRPPPRKSLTARLSSTPKPQLHCSPSTPAPYTGTRIRILLPTHQHREKSTPTPPSDRRKARSARLRPWRVMVWEWLAEGHPYSAPGWLR